MGTTSTSKISQNRRAVAIELHRASLQLLRRLRQVDQDLGITTARLSALSVLVFVGPQTVGRLATIEQVSQPTMTSLVQGLIAQKLIRAKSDPHDRRVRRLHSTAKGKQLLHRGQKKRIDALLALMTPLPKRDWQTLAKAAKLIQRSLDAPVK